MDKIARKPSPDPNQEKLRQTKAVWNKEVSSFINDLINFKKMMNGWPSKFHMERSFIKDPIPADPGTILGVLASDFQDLAQRGNSIIAQQLEYSKNRKQKQPKPSPGVAPPAPAVPNLGQQLAASADYQLIAEGSNSFTRLFSRLKGPWLGGSPEVRARKYRLAMLRAAAVLEKELEKFEATILGSSGESIFIASKLLHQIEAHLAFINDSLNVFNVPQQSQNLPSAPGQVKEEVVQTNPLNEQIDAAKEVIADFRRNYANFTDLDSNLVRSFSSLILKFLAAPDADKVNIVPEIIGVYHAILADANAKNGTSAPTLADVLLSKKASTQIEIVAQNIINKWIGKAKHTIDPFDKTSPIRLDISKESEQIRKTLDKMMNALENKEVNTVEISSFVKEILDKVARIKLLMKPLEATIQNKLFDDTFVRMLEKNKLTDYPSDLSPKEKEHLTRMLKTRQFRGITDLYSRNK